MTISHHSKTTTKKHIVNHDDNSLEVHRLVKHRSDWNFLSNALGLRVCWEPLGLEIQTLQCPSITKNPKGNISSQRSCVTLRGVLIPVQLKIFQSTRRPQCPTYYSLKMSKIIDVWIANRVGRRQILLWTGLAGDVGMVYLLNMVIFNSYVSLPEGNAI